MYTHVNPFFQNFLIFFEILPTPRGTYRNTYPWYGVYEILRRGGDKNAGGLAENRI
nr:MAG TPA: hypothetical protein [Caudoviricetes sp.]